MEVTFYGLNNDADNVYYAVLLVEDDLNNSLSFVVKITVKQSENDPMDIPFTAKYDCATRSVKVSYENYGVVKPTVSNNDAERPRDIVYNEQNMGEE
jgi:hypothetical protein